MPTRLAFVVTALAVLGLCPAHAETRTAAMSPHTLIAPIAGNPAYRNGGNDPAEEEIVDETGPADSCVQACRSRYHDCQRLGQLPDFQCRGIYRDCTTNSCGVPGRN